ncbi:MAG: ABC transporter ATP-binding protein [Candidatus Hydrogenedentes bacterium]|nr:ABC transporter ATP-binding protein [Candidatus Hydrogenedentota bacterium]
MKSNIQNNNYLLEIENLKVYFSTVLGTAYAVDDISFKIRRGQAVALVGESGCGKTVTALSILRLLHTPPLSHLSGRIKFEGRDLITLSEEEMRRVRGRHISMVFQEPMSSLNPVFRVGDQIADVMKMHFGMTKEESFGKIEKVMEWVGITDPHMRLRQYPYELSGGLVQRVMIAMAVVCEPKLLIADEPTTALDVTIQAEILKLLRRIKHEKEMSVLLISHDLSVVARIAEWVVVLYAGKKVEEGSSTVIYAKPTHPYTKALFDALPAKSGGKKRLNTIPGSVPLTTEPPKGCRFHPRCPSAMHICEVKEPPWIQLSPEQGNACWLYAGEEIKT